MNYFLGHLPIELKLNSNQTQVQIIPKYFPYGDDFFRKIYYKADQLYLCLEMEDPKHKFIRRKMHRKKYDSIRDQYFHINYRKKLHTKFFGIQYWEIDNSNLGSIFTYDINDIYNHNCLNRNIQGRLLNGDWIDYKFKIRATYRYDWEQTKDGIHINKFFVYNKTRTNVFSNELELTITADTYN